MSTAVGIVVPLVLVLIAVALFVLVVRRDGWTQRPRTWPSRLIHVGIAAAFVTAGSLLLGLGHHG